MSSYSDSSDFIQSCFYPNISYEGVEKTLRSIGEDGSFLLWLRNRVNGNYHYTISVIHNDEIVSVEIYANGGKFYVEASGRQFNSINDLILYYKECPLKTDKGVDIHLDQGIVSDNHATGNTGNSTYIPPIKWHPNNFIVTLSTIDTENVNGMIQVTPGQNGALTINLSGSTGDRNSHFKMYQGDVQNDQESKDPNQLYTVICLESCTYPGNYLQWTSMPNHHIESVEIKSCSTSEGSKPPTSTREVVWFRQPIQPPQCDQNDYSQDIKQTKGTDHDHTREVSAFPLSANSSDDIHKLAAWTQPPPCKCKSDAPCYYLTFEPIQHVSQDHKPKLTPEFSLSNDILFSPMQSND